MYTQGRDLESKKSYKTKIPALNDSTPLVILINGNSASASEIVSGTIQDLDRGLVVGQRSYGKGLVQTTRPLVYNTQIKFTTAKYYIPSGRCKERLCSQRQKEKPQNGDSRTEFKTKNGRIVYDGQALCLITAQDSNL